MLELPSNFASDIHEMATFNVSKGEYIVQPGDDDRSLYVVLSGALAVYIKHNGGKECFVKRIGKGHSFFSFLSIIDILMDNESKFKTVSLKAHEDSRVAKFDISGFKDSYRNSPEMWVRPIQIVCTRLLHVTMTTLHQYLGLSEELMKLSIDNKQNSAEEKPKVRFGNSIRLAKGLRPKMRRLYSYDEAHDQLHNARKLFAEALGIPSDRASELLQERIDMMAVNEDDVIVEQGSNDDVKLVLVVTGVLKLCQDIPKEATDEYDDVETEKFSTFVFQKEMVGGLQLLTDEPSFYKVKAAANSVLAVIRKPQYEKLLAEYPQIALHIAHSVIKRISPFVRGVDFAIDWTLLDSGQAVYRTGEKSDSIYVVLSGRMRSVDKKQVLEEFGKGSVIGMIEVIQNKPRSSTVLAIRFSQLAEISEGLLNFIKMQFPSVGFRLIKLLGQYFDSSNSQNTLLNGPLLSIDGISQDAISHISNLHTIAILPASADVPIKPFTCELYHALNGNKKVLRLSSATITAQLGKYVLDKQADFKLIHWLNAQEDDYPLIIYECDYEASVWTRRCLKQADAILVVANGRSKPLEKSFLEEHMMMNQESIRTSKELILLWDEDVKAPHGTYEWLKGSYFTGHHHVKMSSRMRQWDGIEELKESDVLSYYEKSVYQESIDIRSDFSRLARILTGQAIGLVLGGGGARGAHHVSILRALQENSIPIDIIGGTSMGSFIGGVYAEFPNGNIEDRVSGWFKVMSSKIRQAWDLTYGHSAMFTGAGFNATIRNVFKDKLIEDCWISYFCITTDITSSEMRVHRSGSLFSYVRASMSLAGYLPPLCDPLDGHLLLDGGYVNNLPADVMKSMGTKHVIAVDVGSREEGNLYNYGDQLSGVWVLLRRLNPWARPLKILKQDEIQSRLAYVSCTRQLEMVKKAPYCTYLRPPVETIGTLEFDRFEEIMKMGYEYGMTEIKELIETNENIKEILEPNKKQVSAIKVNSVKPTNNMTRASSFTDLAARLSKIPDIRSNQSISNFGSLDICEESSDEEGTPERVESSSRSLTPLVSFE
uniref:Swiss cheese n=1 Tax=Rhabditophanes sp. KR3021 TaxID=114890 RepID=A0AC35TVI7_9BILA